MAATTPSTTPLNPLRRDAEHFLDFAIHGQNSDSRVLCEAYIREQYRNMHGAKVTSFLPQILCISHQQQLQACVGLRAGSETPLFLESYLDCPIEQAIAHVCRGPVNRSSIIEVGNLVSTHRGGSLLLFILMASALERAGFLWLAFTATPQVEKLVKRLGVHLAFLAKADGSRMGSDIQDWGRYYQSNPKVLACHLPNSIAALWAQPMFSNILKNHHHTIERLAGELRPVRRQ